MTFREELIHRTKIGPVERTEDEDMLESLKASCIESADIGKYHYTEESNVVNKIDADAIFKSYERSARKLNKEGLSVTVSKEEANILRGYNRSACPIMGPGYKVKIEIKWEEE